MALPRARSSHGHKTDRPTALETEEKGGKIEEEQWLHVSTSF